MIRLAVFSYLTLSPPLLCDPTASCDNHHGWRYAGNSAQDGVCIRNAAVVAVAQVALDALATPVPARHQAVETAVVRPARRSPHLRRRCARAEAEEAVQVLSMGMAVKLAFGPGDDGCAGLQHL